MFVYSLSKTEQTSMKGFLTIDQPSFHESNKEEQNDSSRRSILSYRLPPCCETWSYVNLSLYVFLWWGKCVWKCSFLPRFFRNLCGNNAGEVQHGGVRPSTESAGHMTSRVSPGLRSALTRQIFLHCSAPLPSCKNPNHWGPGSHSM